MERVCHACEVFNKNLIFGQKGQFCLGVLYEQFALSPNEDVRERNSLHHHLSLCIPSAKKQIQKEELKIITIWQQNFDDQNAFLTNVVQVVVQAWKFALGGHTHENSQFCSRFYKSIFLFFFFISKQFWILCFCPILSHFLSIMLFFANGLDISILLASQLQAGVLSSRACLYYSLGRHHSFLAFFCTCWAVEPI